MQQFELLESASVQAPALVPDADASELCLAPHTVISNSDATNVIKIELSKSITFAYSLATLYYLCESTNQSVTMATLCASFAVPDLTLPSVDELKPIYVRRLLEIPADNELVLYGYGYHVALPETDRYEALHRAIRCAGLVKVLSKLRFLAELKESELNAFAHVLRQDWIWTANL